MTQHTEYRVCLGQILGAHGVRGQVKLASFTSDPEDITAYGPLTDEAGKRTYALMLGSWNKTHFIATLDGVSDRDGAEKLRGTKLYVLRSALPQAEAGQYYYADLIGLAAQLTDGTRFGKVLDVKNFGAGDILEIELCNGKKMLYPFNNEVVPDVQLAQGFLVIEPPDYLPEAPREEEK